MKNSIFFILSVLLALSCSSSSSNRNIASKFGDYDIEAYMSPTEGEYAFNRMYDLITNAENEINITVYSWSDGGFTKAMQEVMDKKNPPILRVVMKKDVFKGHEKVIEELEKKGAMFKMAKLDLHEKFVLVDDKFLLNSSANMSGGAKTRYSEDFVFFNAEDAPINSDRYSIIKDFKHEFSIIWNSAHDYKTKDELRVADIMNHKLKNKNKSSSSKNLTLYSSSMNYKVTAPSKTDFAKGAAIGLERIPNKKNQIWTVKSALIKAINEAKENIFVNINHFNLQDISDALIEATKRGVDVRLVVDSQEFKTYINNKEMTPQFVEDWHKTYGNNKEAPVRVKFYSFYPHFSTWYLNHHKYMLIDYNKNSGVGTKLLAGSYNYSKTAEHGKFDNQILYQGEKFQNIYKKFHEEFENLWYLERDAKDQVKQANLDYYSTAKNSLLPLHSSLPISLTWKEATDLKSELMKRYPESKNFSRFKHCYFYDVKKKSYIARNAKSVCK